MAEVLDLAMAGDSPKDGKSRRKSNPSSFEVDVVDGFPVRSFLSAEAAQAFMAARASQLAFCEEQRKQQEQEAMRLQQQQQLERFRRQQRLQQAEDERARKRMRRIEDRKYPESEFITEHGIESMVPSPTYNARARAKSDSDSDYEPSVAKKKRRASHSHRTNRRNQSHRFSDGSSSSENDYRPASKHAKLSPHATTSPGVAVPALPHARHSPLHAGAGTARTSHPAMPLPQRPAAAAASSTTDSFTHMSREAIEQYQRAVIAQSSGGSTSDVRQGPHVPEQKGPPPLRAPNQFAIPNSRLFTRQYPPPSDEVHWPIVHVSLANRIKQHVDGGRELPFESIRDTLPTYLPRPSFGVNGNGGAAQPVATRSSASAMQATNAAAHPTDHHGPPATAPAFQSATNGTSSSAAAGDERDSQPTSPLAPTPPPPPLLTTGRAGGSGHSSGTDARRDASPSGSSQLRERLEQPVSSGLPLGPAGGGGAASAASVSPTAEKPRTLAAVLAAGTANKPPTALTPAAAAAGGSKPTLMSVDHKSLVLIDKKPMVGIKTSSGIQYIEVSVTSINKTYSSSGTGKVLVRPNHALSAELMAAITNPIPTTGTATTTATAAAGATTMAQVSALSPMATSSATALAVRAGAPVSVSSTAAGAALSSSRPVAATSSSSSPAVSRGFVIPIAPATARPAVPALHSSTASSPSTPIILTTPCLTSAAVAKPFVTIAPRGTLTTAVTVVPPVGIVSGRSVVLQGGAVADVSAGGGGDGGGAAAVDDVPDSNVPPSSSPDRNSPTDMLVVDEARLLEDDEASKSPGAKSPATATAAGQSKGVGTRPVDKDGMPEPLLLP